MPADGHRRVEPALQGFGAVKEKHPARARRRIGMIAKQDLGAGGDVFEAHLPLAADQLLRHAAHVACGLIRETGEGCPFGLRLDDSAQASADEQRIIDRAGGCRELPNCYSEARAKVHLLARLHQPAGLRQLAVDRRPCAIFGMENVLPRGPCTGVGCLLPLFAHQNRTISAISVAPIG
jgi:hypothetical protein